jgi:hypothetical protein
MVWCSCGDGTETCESIAQPASVLNLLTISADRVGGHGTGGAPAVVARVDTICFAFHDTTFECGAESITVRTRSPSMLEVLQGVLRDLFTF